ncbi:MAG TPA: hypothetical protein VNE62_03785 [Actinomycetota bacterium]|nr:hypothetical protein [Actinomycetota bacterium]
MNSRDVVKEAKKQGWTVDTTQHGHLRFTPPDKWKQICVFSGTPGDQRSIRNHLAEMRRQGFGGRREARGGRDGSGVERPARVRFDDRGAPGRDGR